MSMPSFQVTDMATQLAKANIILIIRHCVRGSWKSRLCMTVVVRS